MKTSDIKKFVKQTERVQSMWNRLMNSNSEPNEKEFNKVTNHLEKLYNRAVQVEDAFFRGEVKHCDYIKIINTGILDK